MRFARIETDLAEVKTALRDKGSSDGEEGSLLSSHPRSSSPFVIGLLRPLCRYLFPPTPPPPLPPAGPMRPSPRRTHPSPSAICNSCAGYRRRRQATGPDGRPARAPWCCSLLPVPRNPHRSASISGGNRSPVPPQKGAGRSGPWQFVMDGGRSCGHIVRIPPPGALGAGNRGAGGRRARGMGLGSVIEEDLERYRSRNEAVMGYGGTTRPFVFF
jgi:hypothetical protein